MLVHGITLWLTAAAWLLPPTARGWCLEGESGPCLINVRSKAKDSEPRGLAFFGADDKIRGALFMTPKSSELSLLLGGDQPKDQCLRVTELGYLALGPLASERAEFQIDAVNKLESSVLSLAGTSPGGTAQGAGTCAAILLEDFAKGERFSMVFDSVKRSFGFGLTPKAQGPQGALDVSQALFSLSTDAPQSSLALDAKGQLRLQQQGANADKFSSISLARARGASTSTAQIVLAQDILGEVNFDGHDGTNFLPGVSLRGVVDGPVAPGKIIGRLELGTSGPDGAKTRATLNDEEMHLQNGVGLHIGSGGNIRIEKGDLLVENGEVVITGPLTATGQTALGEGLLVASGDVAIAKGSLLVSGADGGIKVSEGDIQIASGALNVKGRISTSNDIAVEQNLQVGGRAAIQGSLAVSGSSTKMEGELNVQGDTSIGGNLHVSGPLGASFQSGAYVYGRLGVAPKSAGNGAVNNKDKAEEMLFVDANPEEKLFQVRGEMVIDDALACSELRITGGDVILEQGDTLGKGQAAKGGNMIVPGGLHVGGTANFGGQVLLASDEDSTSTETGALIVRGGIGVERAITIGDGLYLGDGGTMSISSAADDAGNEAMSIAGNTIFGNKASFPAGVSVGMNPSSESNAKTMEFGFDAAGAISAASIHSSETVQVDGSLVLGSVYLTVDTSTKEPEEKVLTVTGALLAEGFALNDKEQSFRVEKNGVLKAASATFEESLTVSGDVSIGGATFHHTSSEDKSAGGLAISGPVAFVNSVSFEESLTVSGDVSIGGTTFHHTSEDKSTGGLAISGPVAFANSVSFEESLTVSGDVSIGGTTFHHTSEDKSTGGLAISGPVAFANPVSFEESLTVNGDVSIGGTTFHHTSSEDKSAGGLAISGPVAFANSVSFEENLTVSGDVSIGGTTFHHTSSEDKSAGGLAISGPVAFASPVSFEGISVGREIDNDGQIAFRVDSSGATQIAGPLEARNITCTGALKLGADGAVRIGASEDLASLLIKAPTVISDFLRVEAGGLEVLKSDAQLGQELDSRAFSVDAKTGDAFIGGSAFVAKSVAFGDSVLAQGPDGQATLLTANGGFQIFAAAPSVEGSDAPATPTFRIEGNGDTAVSGTLSIAGKVSLSSDTGRTEISSEGIKLSPPNNESKEKGQGELTPTFSILTSQGLYIDEVANLTKFASQILSDLTVAGSMHVLGQQSRLGDSLILSSSHVGEDQEILLPAAVETLTGDLLLRAEKGTVVLSAGGENEDSKGGATITLDSSGNLNLGMINATGESKDSSFQGVVLNATHLEMASLGSTISASNVRATSLCSDQEAGQDPNGGDEAGTDPVCLVFGASGSTALSGKLAVSGSVDASGGITFPPLELKTEIGGVVDIETPAGFVIVSTEAKDTATRVDHAEACYAIRLPNNADAGRTMLVQNRANCEAELVQLTHASESPEFISQIPGRGATASLIFDGERWTLPSKRRLDTVELYDVNALVASADIDIGSHSLAAQQLVASGLAAAETTTSLGDSETCDESESSADGDQTRCPTLTRLALVSEHGALEASSPNSVAISRDGKLRIGGIDLHGDIQVNGNALHNASIEGGTLRDITELHVKADLHLGGAVAESSDRRLKREIAPLDASESLEKLLQLQGVQYKDNSSLRPGRVSEKLHLGLVAQEVEKIVPHVVVENPLSNAAAPADEPFKAVQYARFVPLLIESIKALETKIQRLEERLASLEKS